MVVAIDTGERGDANAALKAARGMRDKHKLTYPFWVDTDKSASKAFGITAFPTNVIIDQKGIVRYYGQGFDGDAIDAALKELRASAGK
jgi:peroxiredoxin